MMTTDPPPSKGPALLPTPTGSPPLKPAHNNNVITSNNNANNLSGMTAANGSAVSPQHLTNGHSQPNSVQNSNVSAVEGGTEMSGSVISQPRVSDQPDTDTIKMFVGQVPRNMDENDLRGMFEDFGPVYQINVLRDKITGQSKGRTTFCLKFVSCL